MLRDHVWDGELVVPAGRYFVMGDNRDLSDDSRFWGFVPRENTIGKPWVIYWSYDAPTERLLEFRLDHFADMALRFFDKTRWERSFQVVKPLGGATGEAPAQVPCPPGNRPRRVAVTNVYPVIAGNVCHGWSDRIRVFSS